MDIDDIILIIEKFNQESMSELRYKVGSVELHLKRHVDQVFPSVLSKEGNVAAPQAPLLSPSNQTSTGLSEMVISPIVGTVYRSPAPDAPPFAQEGGLYKKGDILCIIEAMKVMNELLVEFDCEVLRVLVDNQQAVEYGTPLFEVRRR